MCERSGSLKVELVEGRNDLMGIADVLKIRSVLNENLSHSLRVPN